jgi:hypothetical protein
MIEAALASGRWGHLAAHVDQWTPYIDNLVEDTGQAPVYRGWLDIWQEARSQAGEIQTQLANYEAQMRRIFAGCGFATVQRPAVTLGASPEEKADAYCARRHAWQTDLELRARAFADLHSAQSAQLPGDPRRAFRHLWLFTGQTDAAAADEAARTLAEGRTELDRLKTWLAVRTEEPFPAEELGLVPLGSVPVVRDAFDAVWAALSRSVDLIAPQLSVWRNWEDATLAGPLDAIAELQKEIVLSREPYGDDLGAWRRGADHAALSRLLGQIEKVYPLLRRKIDAAKR